MAYLGEFRMQVNRSLLRATAVAAVALTCLSVGSALAQNSLGLGAPEQAIRPEGPFASILLSIQQYQKEFYQAMTEALRAMREDGSHVWTLAGLSFAYGVFHAAGPGHGKAVISSYMIANELQARRGIVLSFASALLQAVTAIVLIGAFVLVLRGLGLRSASLVQWLEIASYAAVSLLGAWLLWSKLTGRGHSHAGHHHRAHDHAHHSHAHAHHEHAHHDHAHHGHDHEHDHAHGPACGHEHDHEHGPECGHLHAPDPKMLGGRLGLREAWSAILAVGLRPCSGAIVVLTFAFLNGLYWAGIFSTLAMAVGTGITVATLAALAVGAKDLAIRLSGASGRASSMHRLIEIGGAAMVLLLGLTLLTASLQ
jgi:nickel/cobalt exporter